MTAMKCKGIKRRLLNRSITIGCVAFIIILCVLLSIANLNIYRQYVYDDYRGYIRDILDYTVCHIDGDDLKHCIETLEESPKYKETLLFMDDLMEHFQDKLSAHEVGIQDVLGLLTVTGHKIPDVVVIGAQPYDVEAGVELSEGMLQLLPQMVEQALTELKNWGIEPRKHENVDDMDYHKVAEDFSSVR